MKSHFSVKFFALTILTSCTLLPLEAKSQSIHDLGESNINHNGEFIIADIEQGDVESGWADFYNDRAEVEQGWVDWHEDRGEMQEALERQQAAAEAEQQAEERRQAAMEEYQNP